MSCRSISRRLLMQAGSSGICRSSACQRALAVPKSPRAAAVRACCAQQGAHGRIFGVRFRDFFVTRLSAGLRNHSACRRARMRPRNGQFHRDRAAILAAGALPGCDRVRPVAAALGGVGGLAGDGGVFREELGSRPAGRNRRRRIPGARPEQRWRRDRRRKGGQVLDQVAQRCADEICMPEAYRAEGENGGQGVRRANWRARSMFCNDPRAPAGQAGPGGSTMSAHHQSLILHQYDMSPFSEKIRVIFGMKGLELACLQPAADHAKARAGGADGWVSPHSGAADRGGFVFRHRVLIADELERRFPSPSIYARIGARAWRRRWQAGSTRACSGRW